MENDSLSYNIQTNSLNRPKRSIQALSLQRPDDISIINFDRNSKNVIFTEKETLDAMQTLHIYPSDILYKSLSEFGATDPSNIQNTQYLYDTYQKARESMIEDIINLRAEIVKKKKSRSKPVSSICAHAYANMESIRQKYLHMKINNLNLLRKFVLSRMCDVFRQIERQKSVLKTQGNSDQILQDESLTQQILDQISQQRASTPHISEQTSQQKPLTPHISDQISQKKKSTSHISNQISQKKPSTSHISEQIFQQNQSNQNLSRIVNSFHSRQRPVTSISQMKQEKYKRRAIEVSIRKSQQIEEIQNHARNLLSRSEANKARSVAIENQNMSKKIDLVQKEEERFKVWQEIHQPAIKFNNLQSLHERQSNDNCQTSRSCPVSYIKGLNKERDNISNIDISDIRSLTEKYKNDNLPPKVQYVLALNEEKKASTSQHIEQREVIINDNLKLIHQAQRKEILKKKVLFDNKVQQIQKNKILQENMKKEELINRLQQKEKAFEINRSQIIHERELKYSDKSKENQRRSDIFYINSEEKRRQMMKKLNDTKSNEEIANSQNPNQFSFQQKKIDLEYKYAKAQLNDILNNLRGPDDIENLSQIQILLQLNDDEMKAFIETAISS